MAYIVKPLETGVADFLAVACDTAHFYYDAVQDAVNIPVIHLMNEVTNTIWIHFPEENWISILAFPAIAMTGLYGNAFGKHGLKDIWPDPENQKSLLDVI